MLIVLGLYIVLIIAIGDSVRRYRESYETPWASISVAVLTFVLSVATEWEVASHSVKIDQLRTQNAALEQQLSQLGVRAQNIADQSDQNVRAVQAQATAQYDQDRAQIRGLQAQSSAALQQARNDVENLAGYVQQARNEAYQSQQLAATATNHEQQTTRELEEAQAQIKALTPRVAQGDAYSTLTEFFREHPNAMLRLYSVNGVGDAADYVNSIAHAFYDGGDRDASWNGAFAPSKPFSHTIVEASNEYDARSLADDLNRVDPGTEYAVVSDLTPGTFAVYIGAKS